MDDDGQDYGAAQPIADAFNKVTGKKKPQQPTPAKPDTSWHDDQVKAANDEFRKLQEQKQNQPKAPVLPKANGKTDGTKRGGK